MSIFMSIFLLRFVPFIGAIQNNHPYLAGINLQQRAIQNELYVVDLADIALDEPTVRTCFLYGI